MQFEKEILEMEQKLEEAEIGLNQMDREKILEEMQTGQLVIDDDVLLFKKIILEDQELLIPKDFELMLPELIRVKYPYIHCADYIFKDSENIRDFSYELLPQSVEVEDFQDLAYSLFNSFRRLSPDIELYNEQFHRSERNSSLIFDFSKSTLDDEVYIFMAISYINGMISMLSFCSPTTEKNVWFPVCIGIVDSISELEEK